MNKLTIKLLAKFKNFAEHGGLLFSATLLAIFIANSQLYTMYKAIADTKIGIWFIDTFIGLTARDWVNDFLMAFFFMVMTIEIKEEILHGHLSTKKSRALPIIAAICGVMLPTLIYHSLNHDIPAQARGWAIPAATDIAFAFGALSLLGNYIPPSLRVFVIALAIIDDLIAVLIIAIFYTYELSEKYIAMALVLIFILWVLNKKKYYKPKIYYLIGVALWYCLFQSGIHATIGGAILGLMLPIQHNKSFKDLEFKLKHFNTYLILPMFAFFNSDLMFSVNSFNSFFDNNVSLGILIGLFIGKQSGIFISSYSMIKLGIVTMPKNTNYLQLYVAAILCGIGFTMSLFIALLSFPDAEVQLHSAKLGVITGSLLSLTLGLSIGGIHKKILKKAIE